MIFRKRKVVLKITDLGEGVNVKLNVRGSSGANALYTGLKNAMKEKSTFRELVVQALKDSAVPVEDEEKEDGDGE